MQKLYMYLPKIYSKEKLDINFRNLYTKEKQKNLEYEKTYLHPTSLRHNLRRNCFHPRRKIFLASALHSSRYRIDFYFDSYKSNITIKRLWCCLRINYRILHNPFRSINRFHPRGPESSSIYSLWQPWLCNLHHSNIKYAKRCNQSIIR